MDLTEIVRSFSKLKVAVWGDIIVDEYIFGYTSRISREAPVLILDFDYKTVGLGAAGNTISNIISLGGSVIPLSVVGNDDMGREILRMFQEKGTITDNIVVEDDRFTTTKMRILAGGFHTTRQQVIRVDREEKSPLKLKVNKRLKKICDSILNDVDAMIISDYGLGIINEDMIDYVNRVVAHESGKVISVDSRRQVMRFHGVTSITPNETEVEAALNIQLETEDDVDRVGEMILKETGDQVVLITRGRKGMSLFTRDGDTHMIPVFGGDQVADVTGAGDTVISALTLSLAAGATPLQATNIANVAAGIAVTKMGAYNVRQDELLKALEEYTNQ